MEEHQAPCKKNMWDGPQVGMAIFGKYTLPQPRLSLGPPCSSVSPSAHSHFFPLLSVLCSRTYPVHQTVSQSLFPRNSACNSSPPNQHVQAKSPSFPALFHPIFSSPLCLNLVNGLASV